MPLRSWSTAAADCCATSSARFLASSERCASSAARASALDIVCAALYRLRSIRRPLVVSPILAIVEVPPELPKGLPERSEAQEVRIASSGPSHGPPFVRSNGIENTKRFIPSTRGDSPLFRRLSPSP